MKKGRLSIKIFSRILFVLLIGQVLYGLIYFHDVKGEKIKDVANREKLAAEIIRSKFESMRRVGSLAIDSITSNPVIEEALYLRQRARLKFYTLPLWKSLKEKGVAQFQFHTPPATSFLRLHKLRKYGDDLSKFRKTVIKCNAERRPIYGFELGRGGWGYRVVAPVFYMGRHTGSVELGMKISENTLQEFKDMLGGEWALFSLSKLTEEGDLVWLDKPKAIAYTNDDIKQSDVSDFLEDNLDKLKDGEIVSRLDPEDGMIEVLLPMKDFSGRVGFVFVYLYPSNMQAIIRGVILKTLALSLILLIVMSVVSMLTINSSLKPIVEITGMIDEISSGEGDLTKHIRVNSNDEIGELAKGFNRFIDSQREMIGEIKARVDKLLAQMNDLVNQIIQVDQSAKEQNDHVSRVATAVEEMNSTVAEIANNADSAVQVSDEASNKAKHGRDVVGQTMQGMNTIAQVVGRASERINSLGEKSAQIGEIIGVIDDIADQTNLLALNAAIEAARAGEQGRGFAVVADEVRKLAERTSQATKEVADTIKTIQKETKDAVSAMDETRQEVERGKELADASSQALSEIENSTDTVSAMISQIANATREQSRATEEITQSIEGITLLSNQASEISSSSRQIVESLANLVNEIKSQVDRFKL